MTEVPAVQETTGLPLETTGPGITTSTTAYATTTPATAEDPPAEDHSPGSYGPDWLQGMANILGYAFCLAFLCAFICHLVAKVLSKCFPGRFPRTEERCIRCSIFCLGLTNYIANARDKLNELQAQNERQQLIDETQADGGAVLMMP